MSTELHKNIVRRIYAEESFRHGTDYLDEISTVDLVTHNLFPGAPPGREGIKVGLRIMLEAFPDARFIIEVLVAEGDLVAARVLMRGTHLGPLMGIAATGRPVELCEHIFFRFAGGKIVESWGVRDDQGMLGQLGLSPAAGAR